MTSLRFLRSIGICIAGLILQLGALQLAGATSPIGYPTIQCSTTAPSLNTATNPGYPGHWGDPNRYGTGWEFFYTSNTSQIIVYWLTYNAAGQPVWLSNGGSSTRETAANGAAEFWSPLYAVTQPPTTGSISQTATQVGYVAIVFVPGQTTVAGLRWQWNAVSGAAQPDECVYDFGHTATSSPGSSTSSSTSSSSVDESYTGVWDTSVANQGGWGLAVTELTSTQGGTAITTEIDEPLIYDTAGQAVWLQGVISGSQQSPVPVTSASASLYYVRSNYTGGFPTSNCTSQPCAFTPYANSGTVTRDFSQNTASITASVSATVTGGAPVSWPNAPIVNPATLTKLSELNYVAVNVTNCTVPAGKSCAVAVAWSSSYASGLVYRRNLTTNTLSSSPISSGSSGNFLDNLPIGSDVQYELHNGASTGALLFQSAEVKVSQLAQTGAATPPPPQLASSPADDVSSDGVGSTAGKFSVDQAGNSQYEIPLYAPRGAGGFTPHVSLVYNSGFGDGLLGFGWQLQGLSTISVCRLSQEHGDGQSSIGLLSTIPALSAYCLDGERMDLVSGTHGAAGAVYRLESDNQSEIVIESATTVDGVTGSTYNVPTVFAVYGKDGTVRHYGGSALLRYSSGGISGVTLSWYQYLLQDSNGNKINFNYGAQTASAPTALVPTSITYSGGEIDFASNARPSLQQSVSYVSGVPFVTQPAWIQSITVKSGSTILRTYTPTYSTTQLINSSLQTIISLKECSATAVCYYNNPNMFQYAPVTSFASNQAGQVYTSTSAQDYFFHAQPDTVRFADVDGDGRNDVVFMHCDVGDTSCDFRDFIVGYSTPSASGGIQFSPLTCNPTSNSGYDPNASCPEFAKFYDYQKSWQLIDFNGDGRADLLLLQSQTAAGEQSGPYQLAVWQSAGAKGTYPFSSANKLVNIAASNVRTQPLGPMVFSSRVDTYMADFDGDGLPDLLTIDDAGNANIWLFKPTGNSMQPYGFQGPYSLAFGTPQQSYTCAGGTGALTQQALRTADFDGDGKADVVLEFANGPCIPTSTTGGATSAPSQNSTFKLQTRRTFDATLKAVQAAAVASSGSSLSGTTSTGSYPCAQAATKCLQAFTAVGVSGSSFYVQPSVGLMWQVGSNTSSSPNQRWVSVDTNFQVADINGDGLTDVAYEAYSDSNDNATWIYELNEGGVRGASTCITSPCQVFPGALQTQLGDYDGDGKADFWAVSPWLPPGANVYYVYLWTGSGFASTPIQTNLYSGDIGTGKTWTGFVVDLDGDGYPDSLEVQALGDNGEGNGTWKSSRNTSHHQPRNVVTAVTSGLNAVTSLTYAPLTFTSVYFREYNGFQLSSGWGSPVQDVLSPRFVVEYADSSAPLDSSPSNLSTIRYQYAGFKMQGGGRGALGFDRIYTTDAQTGIETVTTYGQSFPLTGTPTSTTAYTNGNANDAVCDISFGGSPDSTSCMAYGVQTAIQSNQQVISSNLDSWIWHVLQQPAANTNTALTAAQPIFVSRLQSRTAKYGLDGTLYSFATTLFSYDYTYGNVLSTSSTEYSAAQSTAANALRQTVTTETWTNKDVQPTSSNGYQAAWHIGRMATSKTTATPWASGNPVTSQARTRNAEFTYDPTTGQLTVEKLQPLVPTDGAPAGDSSTALDKYHFYDSYGNEIETVTCSEDAACSSTVALTASAMTFENASDQYWVQRYARSDFSSTSGVYANYTYSPFWNGSSAAEYTTLTVNSRDAFGSPTKTTDLHGVVTTSATNSLGRPYFSATSTGSAIQTIYRWCSGYGPTGATTMPCPSGAAYRIDATSLDSSGNQNRSPEIWTYYDVLERPILKVQQGFAAGQYNAVSTSYDALGRIFKVSEPYSTSSPTSTTIAPGTSTTQCGAALYCSVTTYDALGRVLRLTHPNNAQTQTTYAGLNITTTLPANGSGNVETKTQAINLLGQVSTITDALGSTLTNYFDASGNLTQVTRYGAATDKRSASTYMGYDALGRRTSLNDSDSGSWTFQYNAVGEQVKKYNSSSTATCTSSRFDGLGRVFSRADYKNADCTGTVDAITSWTYDYTAHALGSLVTAQSTDSSDIGGTGSEVRNAYYDAYGRLSERDTTINGARYVQLSTYDNYGRAFQTLFQYQGSGLPQSGELYAYNPQGYAYQTQDAEYGTAGVVYATVLSIDARGHITQERRGSNSALTTIRSYDPAMGWLTGISSGSPSGSITNGAVESLSYNYDLLGNVTQRTDVSPGATIYEWSTYDSLQRLTLQQVASSPTGTRTNSESQTFDSFGNATNINGNTYLNGQYGSTAIAQECNAANETTAIGSDAVTGDPAGNDVRCFDAHGNVTRLIEPSDTSAPQSNKRKQSYSAYDTLRTIYFASSLSLHTTAWNYGIDRQRLVRQDYPNSAGSGTPVTNHFVGNVEIDNANTASPTVKRYVGALILSQTLSGSSVNTTYEYLYTDLTGSTHRIVDQNGILESPNGTQWFGPFGVRASPSTGLTLDGPTRFSYNASLTHHGFTGHEMMDESALIHMNGRAYDYNQGHFEQADPFVQDASDLQSYNRYSYLRNNPLAATDPSGYWGTRQQAYLRDIAAIAISVWGGWEAFEALGGTAGSWATATAAAKETALTETLLAGFSSGYISSGNLSGAVEGAFDAGVSLGIANTYGVNTLQYVTAHAIEGGVMAQLQNGRFGHGFVSAGLSAWITPNIHIDNHFVEGVAASIEGGSISQISGGKFANGAVSSAFAAAFSDVASNTKNADVSANKMSALAVKWDDLTYAIAALERVTLPGLGSTYLDDSFYPRVQSFIEYAQAHGVDLHFNSAFRTTQDQANLNNDPAAVTPAAPGHSLHEAGFAVDVNFTHLPAEQQAVIRAAADHANLTWGGTFTSPDPPHFQYDPGTDRQALIRQAQDQYRQLVNP